MISESRILAALSALALAVLVSCGGDDAPAPAGDATVDVPKPKPLAASPGKPTAPISIDYSIVGNPIVGQPVMLNLKVSSELDDRPITVRYRINEVGSMTFPESQPDTIEVLPVAGAQVRSQQLTAVYSYYEVSILPGGNQSAGPAAARHASLLASQP